MRAYLVTFLAFLLSSCALFQGANVEPVLDAVDMRDRIFANQTIAFRRLVDLAEQSQMPAETVAAFRDGIATNEEQFAALGRGLVDLLAELGEVDWRKLYRQIREEIER